MEQFRKLTLRTLHYADINKLTLNQVSLLWGMLLFCIHGIVQEANVVNTPFHRHLQVNNKSSKSIVIPQQLEWWWFCVVSQKRKTVLEGDVTTLRRADIQKLTLNQASLLITPQKLDRKTKKRKGKGWGCRSKLGKLMWQTPH